MLVNLQHPFRPLAAAQNFRFRCDPSVNFRMEPFIDMTASRAYVPSLPDPIADLASRIGIRGMSMMRKFGLGTASIALLATSVTPAAARWGGGYGGGFGWSSWNGGGNGWGRRHRRGDDDTAEVLGGVLIGALIVGAIASSKKKREQQQRERVDTYPDRDDRYDRNDRSQGRIASEDQAVDACAEAAESKAGRSASVRDVDQVRRSGDGWDVEGVVESRDGWRDQTSERRRFTCSVRFGSVDSLYVEDAKVAYAD